MSIQKQLIGFADTRGDVEQRQSDSRIDILTWNLQNPSSDRALKQVNFMLGLPCNILILTELKSGLASELISSTITEAGFRVFCCADIDGSDYVTIIATRTKRARMLNLAKNGEPWSCRIVGVELGFELGSLAVIGMYLPSFGGLFAKQEQIEKKRAYHEVVSSIIQRYFSGASDRLVVGGDLNILEPGHRPPDPTYKEWEGLYSFFLNTHLHDAFRLKHARDMEHSWYSHQGVGLRLDHFFVDTRLVASLRKCEYIHSPRELKLSDHSAMRLQLF